jgi:RHS repeat-associated protein
MDDPRASRGEKQDRTTLSLPKGGGAIRSIGEKFTANPATGTASFSVPVAVTPGRSGFTPEIALHYDSGRGNGPFGLGWSLGVPSITRKTDQRLPRYDGGGDSDVFLLSDAEDLVAVGESDDPTGTSRVRRYQPRIEAAFSRIERWQSKATGDLHWRVLSRDNVLSLYGVTPEGRIVDPAEPSRVFQWLLQERRDDRGNFIVYKYKQEDAADVDPRWPQERNRLLGPGFANRHLKRILYANAPANSRSGWRFEVVLDYGDHDLDHPTPAEGTWTCRSDPFSTCKAGFEIRTWRLCRRILLFHHFPELGAEACLVRSTDLGYALDPSGAQLTSISQSGYVLQGSDLVKRSLPPVELAYSEPVIDPAVRRLDAASAENLPVGLGNGYQLVDLDGEGLAGILVEQAGAWFYKRNLGSARFGPAEPLPAQPVPGALAAGRGQILDLEGSGRKALVQNRPPVPGFFERTEDARWKPFTPFEQQPNLDWNDPNLRFIDLDGDGRSDILIADETVFTWYPSAGRLGFEPAERVSRPRDEEKGPGLVFADRTEAIHLADMSGDGLVDIVRVRNGEVCYWPNLGYGRFGAKVTMEQSPRLDTPDQLDPQRVRLADIDGSGTTDLLYLGRDGVRFWTNQSGNRWSDARVLPPLPHLADPAEVDVVDLLGNGTACLVWSSPLPADRAAPLRYVDLMSGKKPYLLERIVNNLGGETRLGYTSSTAFYRADAAAGTPWVTRLHFPVHCLSRVETVDWLSRTRLITEYTYHHGYFDGVEREFRGFGRVDQRDAEELGPHRGAGLFSGELGDPNRDLRQPPVLTRTWFHTGAPEVENAITRRLPAFALPAGLSVDEEREAVRALKGRLLRQEVRALDGTGLQDLPYSVQEHTYVVRRLHPSRPGSHAVFLVHESEALSEHSERQPSDPRLSHQLTLEVDEFGNVTCSAAVGYPRRPGATAHPVEQTRTLVTLTENRFANEADKADWLRLGVPVETLTWEITGLAPAAGELLTVKKLRDEAVGAEKIDYETVPTPGKIQKRCIENVRTLYLKNDLSGPLDLGKIESLALPHETYKLAFTLGLLAEVFGTDADETTLRTEGGYVKLDGLWWAPSGQSVYDAATAADHFYLPRGSRDPFGNVSKVAYDAHDLLPIKTEDPLQNTVTVRIDYRVLQPDRLTDPNGNRSDVAFDALGRVVGTAVLGRDGEPAVGDSLTGFVADLVETTVLAHIEAPLTDPHAILGTATTRIVYDPWRYRRTRTVKPDGTETGQPAVVYTLARETHTAELGAGEATRVQHSFLYSGGFGQELMTKVQAEPGLAPVRDANGVLRTGAPAFTDKRWAGTGRTIRNNKGNPVKQYEPFFSGTHAWEDEKDLVEAGFSSVLHYDPLSRLVRTDNPDGTFSSVSFTPWDQATADGNDNVAESAWYEARKNLPATDPERQAADRAAAHASTPARAHFDILGRVFRSIEDAGGGRLFATAFELDLEGNQLSVADARGNVALRTRYDLLGRVLRREALDAGTRRTLPDAAGQPIRAWDSRGHRLRHTYDALRRPLDLFLKPGTASEILVERMIHGESTATGLTAAQVIAANLRGRVFRHLDGAGIATSARYDFKGNLLETQRRFAVEFRTDLDWSTSPALETETFSVLTAFDALNRPFQVTTPDGSITRNVYNEARLLEKVNVRLRGATLETEIVSAVEYDAKGQRTRIVYGNRAETASTYDRRTYRLTRLLTTRSGSTDALQDLSYTYDPVGNIIRIGDAAQPTIYFSGAAVTATSEYVYDPLYRLTEAKGREHVGTVVPADGRRPHYDWNDLPRRGLSHPADGTALRRYKQTYDYDAVGNLLRLAHDAGGPDNWTRRHIVPDSGNRLQSTTLPGDPDTGALPVRYTYDEHGNTTSMPHLTRLAWNFKDQLREVKLDTDRTAWYHCDASGQRVRKIIEKTGTIVEERFYLGSFEIYRRRAGGVLKLERETLHLMDDQRRIALAETKTVDADDPTGLLVPVLRYQLGNHLGSAVLELDAAAAVISYEELYPYGATSFQSGRNAAEVSLKRYRFTGKERDEETGFTYHGARYYAPWLGRWTSCDPAGMVDGPNLYEYARGNPIRLNDSNGLKAHEAPPPPPPTNVEFGEESIQAHPDSHVVEGHVPASPKASLIDRLSESSLLRGVAGFAYGTLQGLVPGLFLAPSLHRDDPVYEFFRGAGETSTGVALMVGGAAGEVVGTAMDVVGVGGAPETGGASLALTALGVKVNIASAAVIAQGSVGVGAGLQTMAHALSGSGSGSGTPPKPQEPAPSARPAEPPAQAKLPAPTASTPASQVNFSRMPHAVESAVERAGFASNAKANEALRSFSAQVSKGQYREVIRDLAQADRIIVPGFAGNTAVVYRVMPNGRLELRTVLNLNAETGLPGPATRFTRGIVPK